ncbi:MAG: acetyl-CoA decarbonylase/synthase complex subunit delta [Nitrospirae bacterium CG_4_10_14_0_8_um_filter_41_23]|nr:acetyl-CoA decarbonylase/synthase complex subunit delta [Nitrospirota bacterium]OIP59238.1 MAG: acetyl-CoA decarbonylase/synthase complex subunit delta [Nitrospirae bacterium CG2_30_41_42]PIQ95290.1 MAG: acetyl-CoA decarbonylase/synthase complex subunit delta [Nitrospirae bacterium CG11_big_fil_rev_8_21_14_0_20_41_14]PIV44147.1 MAG: acetyl-CoA decarbonylase/synthase complex subunit delta [Nitrospirae bacterium CG02_land_8_20_14_3_00_41_53]PIW87274.1 MAG: acetyl-CoA decarbonylase/synthase com
MLFAKEEVETAFAPPKDTYSGKVYSVNIGTASGEVTFGGENILPFHTFEGVAPNRPLIAFEIQDVPPTDWPENVQKPYKDVSNDPVSWAKFCQDTLKARAIALRLIGTHPDRENRSPEDAAKTVRDVLSAISIPLIILGSNHAEKDASVLIAAAEAAKDRNCIIGKAQEANYKTIAAAAMANKHKLIAMSELDINLSKQLNILITQMGFDKERLITDPMCSALGYGLEYTYSVMERIRLAALTQNDITMQPPMLGDIGMYVWKVKEAQASEADLPQWGSLEERGIAWEAVTATALIIAGVELLIMRHPKAVEAVEKVIEELV